MQNTTEKEFLGEKNQEARASHPNPHHLRVLRNLNKAKVPYNLHMLQPEGMQEKTLVLAVNL